MCEHAFTILVLCMDGIHSSHHHVDVFHIVNPYLRNPCTHENLCRIRTGTAVLSRLASNRIPHVHRIKTRLPYFICIAQFPFGLANWNWIIIWGWRRGGLRCKLTAAASAEHESAVYFIAYMQTISPALRQRAFEASWRWHCSNSDRAFHHLIFIRRHVGAEYQWSNHPPSCPSVWKEQFRLGINMLRHARFLASDCALHWKCVRASEEMVIRTNIP